MTKTIDDYVEFWDGRRDYGLVKLEGSVAGWMIFDREAWAPVIIEATDELTLQIIERMLGAGVPTMSVAEARNGKLGS